MAIQQDSSYDVFVSHSPADAQIAEQIARGLVDHGLRVCLDRWAVARRSPQSVWNAAIPSKNLSILNLPELRRPLDRP